MATITPILMPFAEARIDNVQPSTTPSLSVVNQPDGFPLYQKLPYGDANYTAVKEEEMNGVLNFYTNILYQLGQGLFFTFDANLAATTGGYAQGAVLWCESNQTFQISLIDNNLANFVTTPSYINDGINWQSITQYPSIYNPTLNDCEIHAISNVNNNWFSFLDLTQRIDGPVGTMKYYGGTAKKSGNLIESSATVECAYQTTTPYIKLNTQDNSNSTNIMIYPYARPSINMTVQTNVRDNNTIAMIGDVTYVLKNGMHCIITKMANGALKYECWGVALIPYNGTTTTVNTPFDNTDVSYSVTANTQRNEPTGLGYVVSIDIGTSSFTMTRVLGATQYPYDMKVYYTLIGIQFTS